MTFFFANSGESEREKISQSFLQIFTNKMKKLIIVLIIGLFTVSIFAADGDLDASFGTGGKVSTDFGNITSDVATASLIQPDGKLVLVGVQDAGSQNRLALARYNVNGSLDASFGTGGKALINNNLQFGLATAAVLQADGKILVSFAGIGAQVARVNSNGTLDTTFGTNGIISISPSGNAKISVANDLILQPDGKILVGGGGYLLSPFTYGFALVRLNAGGALDTSFGTNGITVTTFGNDLTATQAFGIALKADGKIALGGYGVASMSGQGFLTKLLVSVYNPNGSPDVTFGTNGETFTATNENARITSVAFQPDGKIAAAGFTNDNNELGIRGFFRRYTATGAPDASFGTNGAVIVRINNGATKINDLVLQPDGKFVGFGQAFDLPTLIITFAVVRYLPNGTPDTTFGGNGFVTTLFTADTGDSAEAFSGLLQPDGKIVTAGRRISNAGNSSADFAAARYLNSPGTAPVNNPALRIADFDGDGKSDASVFRNGNWYINPSSNSTDFAPSGFYGVQFGLATDKLAPADYDGDGKTDIAVFRENTGDSEPRLLLHFAKFDKYRPHRAIRKNG